MIGHHVWRCDHGDQKMQEISLELAPTEGAPEGGRGEIGRADPRQEPSHPDRIAAAGPDNSDEPAALFKHETEANHVLPVGGAVPRP